MEAKCFHCVPFVNPDSWGKMKSIPTKEENSSVIIFAELYLETSLKVAGLNIKIKTDDTVLFHFFS